MTGPDVLHRPCVVCSEREAERGEVCSRCWARMAGHLRQIPDLARELAGLGYVERDDTEPKISDRAGRPVPHCDPVARVLTAGPLNGASGAPRVSGSSTPPVPIRIDPTDLLGAARHGSRGPHARGVLGLDDDQVGHLPAATVLDTWVRDWAAKRAEHLPVPTVTVLCGWLLDRLDWACDRHPAVDEFVAELRALCGALLAACGRTDPRPEPLPAPCPDCGLLTLWRDVDAERIVCGGGCPRLLDEDAYAEHVQRLVQATRPDTRGGISQTDAACTPGQRDLP